MALALVPGLFSYPLIWCRSRLTGWRSWEPRWCPYREVGGPRRRTCWRKSACSRTHTGPGTCSWCPLPLWFLGGNNSFENVTSTVKCGLVLSLYIISVSLRCSFTNDANLYVAFISQTIANIDKICVSGNPTVKSCLGLSMLWRLEEEQCYTYSPDYNNAYILPWLPWLPVCYNIYPYYN